MTLTARKPSDSDFDHRIEQIETDWARVNEPGHFIMRYGAAIERYLRALITNAHDAEELSQEFFVDVIEVGLPRARQERGRFRDYLKKIVRNRAITFLRRKASARPGGDLGHLPDPDGPDGAPDREWLEEWRRCLLHRTWQRLKEYKKAYFRTLQLCARHPGETSESLAAIASRNQDAPIRADAFRKQVSRARKRFAQFLVSEVADTLDQPNAVEVEAELTELQLIQYVRDFLPLK